MFYENLKAISFVNLNKRILNKHNHKIILQYKANFYNKTCFIYLEKTKCFDCNKLYNAKRIYKDYYKKGYTIFCSNLFEVI